MEANVFVLKGNMKGVNFDVTVNQIGGTYSLYFLNSVSTFFPNYFYKRSVLLAKVWMVHCSRIAGGSMGLISSYAIQVMMLYLLNCIDIP